MQYPQLCTGDGGPLCGPDSLCLRILADPAQNVCLEIGLRCPAGTEFLCGTSCGVDSCIGNCCNCVPPNTRGMLKNAEQCLSSLQCRSNLCSNGVCSSCSSNDECPSHRCTAGVCLYVPVGYACASATECRSNVCTDGLCAVCSSDDQCPSGSRCDGRECTLLDDGSACTAASECLGNRCIGGVCRSEKASIGDACSVGGECRSGLCRGEVCAACNVHSDCGDGRLCYARQCISPPMMGNGVREPSEACDDGNLIDGDGCSSRGRLENAQACSEDRECESNRCFNHICTACTDDDQCASRLCQDGKCADLCGNGTPDAGEECDLDGQNNDFIPDRCRMDCRNPWCGDAVADRSEQCDDGNGVSGDGCDRLCRIEVRTVTIDLPGAPFTADLTGQNRLPRVDTIARSRAPAGSTGPAAIAVMAAGAAAGWAWVRRRRK